MTLTPVEQLSLAVTNAAILGLQSEFLTSVVIYLAEHSTPELVKEAIADANKEWDL